MALRHSTIDNSLNRRRFVHPWAGEQYLDARRRQNLLRVARKVNEEIAKTLAASQYGTDQRRHRAMMLLAAAQTLVSIETQLVRVPPLGEARNNPVQLAAD